MRKRTRNPFESPRDELERRLREEGQELAETKREKAFLELEVLGLRLGHKVLDLATLVRTAKEQRRNAAKRPRRQPWADALAEELARCCEHFTEAWASIPEGEEGDEMYAGYAVYRDGDELCATNNATGVPARPLKRHSFRTEYFGPAKNPAKKRPAKKSRR